MKKLTYLLIYLIVYVQGIFEVDEPDIEDLTTKSGLKKAKREGFDLNKAPYEILFKVAIEKDEYDIGYSWVVDNSRCAGYLQTMTSDPEFESNGDGI